MLLSAVVILFSFAVPAGATSVDLLFAYGQPDWAGLGRSFPPDRAGLSISRISLIERPGDGVPTEDGANVVSGHDADTIFVDVNGNNVVLDEPVYATGFSQMLGTVRAATNPAQHRLSGPMTPFFDPTRTTVDRRPVAALNLFEALPGTYIVAPSAFLDQGNASMLAARFGNVRIGPGSYQFAGELGGHADKGSWANESVLPLPGALWVVLFGLFLLAILRSRRHMNEQQGVMPS